MSKRIGRLPFLMAVLASTMSSSGFAAQPTELFISEYVEGGSNNKAIEIYNGTGAAIDLGVSGYAVFLSRNGGSSTSSIALNGTVADGDVFVIAHTSAALGMTPDQTSGSLDFNGDDAVVLRHNSADVDVIGQVGTDPGTGWGTPPTSTLNTTLRRKDTVCAGDTNGADAFDPSTEWNGFAQDTFSGLGSHTANCTVATPNLSINDVSMAEGDAGPTTFTFTVSIDVASASDVTFDYATTDGTATTADSDYVQITTTVGTITAGNLSTTIDVTVNGDATFEADEEFNVEISSVVGATVVDGAGLGTITDDDAPAWVINEILADPDSADGDANGDGVVSTTNDEFVELVNTSGADADISGWTLADGNSVRHVFAGGTVVPAGCAIVVFAAGTPTGTFGNALVQTASTGSLGLNNGGDSVTLNDGGSDVATYSYGGEGDNDQSLTRDPDITGSDPLVIHSTATGSGSTLFSPGRRIDGSKFSGCPASLSIGDVSQVEGNAGTSLFTFTVSLDSPAGAGGVTFNYSTSDGSATTADNDYVGVPLPGTAGSITAGATSTTFDITVNGDTVFEGTEAFNVAITDVVGASVDDGSALGTILDDDAPNLTVTDVSLLEGNGGTTAFNFTVQLDAPAPPGGVMFTFETFDGSATTADNDYVGMIATPGVISAGSTSLMVPITVNGDTQPETDETFTLVVSGVTNANVVDGTGTGTIQNDDRYPIHTIQGAGSASPLAGQAVNIASAIVTAVGSDRFFMQMADADVDMNPLTSEGIVVYTGAAAPTVLVGDEVEVDGTIVEYFGLTEVSPTTNVTIINSGVTLPAAVDFSSSNGPNGTPSTDPTALSCPGTGPGGTNNVDTNFECFEAMLVSIPEAVALQGNRRRSGDDYAEIQFTPNASRSLRESGVRFPDSPTAANINAGAWDGNPEVMEMDADILGAVASPTEIVGGAEFSAVGVMTFDFGDYVFWPTSLAIDAATNVLPRPVATPMAGTELTVGSFNMLRFCDTIAGEHAFECDGSGSGTGGEPDAGEVAAKIARLSAYLRNVLLSPDVVGVQEVETQAILADLAAQIATDGGPSYSAYLVEGNDGGGIDVGYLVNDARVKNAVVTQYLKSETWDDPNCSPCADLLHDRPPLLLQADFQPTPSDALFPFAVINNHGRSRGGVDTGNDRVRAKRFTQARSIAGLVQEFQSATGTFAGMGTDSTPLILVGDYNAYQFSDGYADVVGLIAGTYDDDANTCSPSNMVTDCKLGGPNIVVPPLQNLVLSVPANEQYSFIFTENFGAVLGYGTPNPARDVATGQVLDNVLVSGTAEPYVSLIEFGRANLDASINGAELGSGPDGMGGTQLNPAIGSSDHDGVVAYFETNCANLTIASGMEPDPDGDGVCSLIDNCPAIANPGQEDSNSNGVGDLCDASPVANGIAFAAIEDTTLSVAAPGVLGNDTDAEGDGLTAALASGPASGSLTLNADGSFAYTPAADVCDDVNPVTFTYTASDGSSSSGAATVSIVVSCVNDAPVGGDDSYLAIEDFVLNVAAPGVLTNDSDVDSGGLTSVNATTPANGSVVLNTDGSFAYTPDADYCSPVGVPDTFTYQVSDGLAQSAPVTVSITVSCVDDPTVLMDDAPTVGEDGGASAINVLSNDSDVDDTLTITGVTQPANGTVVITGGGTGLSYEPDADYCNDGSPTDDFTYTVNTGATANVTVTVTCVDDGPALANDDSASVAEGSSNNLIDVLDNDVVDPDDGSLTIDSVGTPTHGSTSVDGSQVSYTPTPGYCGPDSFDYMLVGGSSATVTVSVTCAAPAIFANGFED